MKWRWSSSDSVQERPREPGRTKVCAVCQVPIDVDPERDAEPTTLVESKPTPTPSQPRVSLAGASLSAKAGDKVETEIRVENPGGVDDSYQLQVLGGRGRGPRSTPRACRWRREHPGLSELIFSPPASTTGVHPYEVRVASRQLPASPVSTVGLLEIVAPTETPKPPPEADAVGRAPAADLERTTVGEHDLTVRNDSDAAVTSQPSATEGQSDVALTSSRPRSPSPPASRRRRTSGSVPGACCCSGRTEPPLRHRCRAGRHGRRRDGAAAAGSERRAARGRPGVIGAVIGIAVAVGSGGSTPKATIPNVAGQDFTQASGALQNNVTGCNPPCFNVVLAGTFSDTAPEGTTVGPILKRGRSPTVAPMSRSSSRAASVRPLLPWRDPPHRGAGGQAATATESMRTVPVS